MNRHQAIRTPLARGALAGLISVAALLLLARLTLFAPPHSAQFDGQRAYAEVAAQLDFGPRITGTPQNAAAGDYIAGQLRAAGWQVEFQSFRYRDVPARNIIARANAGQGPVILLGAHYDTRRTADRDPVQPDQPVPGANDGASGVAVLLELGRTLELRRVPNEVWLAFFDAEDNGGLDGWEWIVGSTYMAQQLTVTPAAVIVVDMVGDADQQFFFDQNSDAVLSARLWATAAGLGYGDHFIPVARWAMLDDHTPFAQRGIPAVDIIDFDYPVWHTTGDKLNQVSAASLERVGRTLAAFLESRDE